MNVLIALVVLALALLLFVPPRWLIVGALLVGIFLLRKHIVAGFASIVGWFRTPPPSSPTPTPLNPEP